MKKPAAIWSVLYWAFLVIQVIPFLWSVLTRFRFNVVPAILLLVFAYLGVRLWNALHREPEVALDVLDADVEARPVRRYSDRLLAGMNLFQLGIALEVVLGLVLSVAGTSELMDVMDQRALFAQLGRGEEYSLTPMLVVVAFFGVLAFVGIGAFVYLVKLRRINKRTAPQTEKG